MKRSPCLTFFTERSEKFKAKVFLRKKKRFNRQEGAFYSIWQSPVTQDQGDRPSLDFFQSVWLFACYTTVPHGHTVSKRISGSTSNCLSLLSNHNLEAVFSKFAYLFLCHLKFSSKVTPKMCASDASLKILNF